MASTAARHTPLDVVQAQPSPALSPTVWLLTRVSPAMSMATRIGIGALIVAASALLAEFLYESFDVTRLSVLFLGGVIVTAVTLGTWPAIFAAVLAVAVYNFHLVEPRFTFTFAGDDALTLAVFLAVALVTGSLAGRVRDEALRSRSRADLMTTLFNASRSLSETDTEEALRARLAAQLAGAVGGEAKVVGPYEAPAGLDDGENPRVVALLARRRGEPGVETLADGPWRARRMTIDGEELGVALWRIGETSAHELDQVDRLADILADLGAAAIARARLSAHKAAADALVSTEKLRTALLSSISHDLRTPLAAILASSSSLKDYDAQFSPETRRDLAANIQEEAERLNRYVTNLLSMTRLESGALDMELQAVSAFEVAAAAAQRVERRKGARRLLLSGPGRPLFVRADPVLLEQALANVVENAVAYSPDGTDVELRVAERDGGVEIEVVDAGPGVADAEIGKIFDKFYRSAGTRQVAEGAGMGLPIAKGFVEAVGGAMTARARPDGASGLSVLVTLPEAEA